MSKDISRILDGWEHDPNRTSVRIVMGEDGREKIQLRLDMGLLQMNFDGRPDGQRPQDKESWFHWYQEKQQEHDKANPDSKPFRLESSDCQKLLREGIQYYHRYLSFWHLGRYELCARDTNRNLRLFAFVREYARHEQDKLQFDQWRPYVIMMHTRAVATPLLKIGDEATALKTIEAGIQGIRRFLEEYDQLEKASECAELSHLEHWREELSSREPRELANEGSNWLTRLRAELQKAIDEERFEDAANLRDQIGRMSSHRLPPGTEERM